MYLIQCFLPLYDNNKRKFPQAMYEAECRTLTERFGGLTGYTQAPATGLWDDEGSGTTRDDLIIYEVMADDLDRDWWRGYRQGLEARFRQDHIVIRAHSVETL